MTRRNCGHCHECGNPLRIVCDGEEWCDTCQAYRRYASHGWVAGHERPSEDVCPCPTCRGTGWRMWREKGGNLDSEYCPDCMEKGECPRCGRETLVEDEFCDLYCTMCGYHAVMGGDRAVKHYKEGLA